MQNFLLEKSAHAAIVFLLPTSSLEIASGVLVSQEKVLPTTYFPDIDTPQ